MIEPYIFGVHHGWLTRRADHIARKHRAHHVNFRVGSRRYGYFYFEPRLGEPFDSDRASAVMAAIEAAGGFDFLRRVH